MAPSSPNQAEAASASDSKGTDPVLVSADDAGADEGLGEGKLEVASLKEMYRFTSRGERIALFGATVCSCIRGAAWPVWTVFFGEAINVVADATEDDISGAISFLALLFVVVGAIEGILAFFEVPITQTMAARISTRLRANFVGSVIRQDMAWHDEHPSAALDVMVSSAVPKIYDGMSSNYSQFWMHTFEGVVGVVVSFIYSWKLSLVFLAASPLQVGSFMMFFLVLLTFEQKASAVYQQAGVVVDEVLSLIRVVMTFGTFDQEEARYTKFLDIVRRKGQAAGRTLGISIGLPDCAMFLMYSLGFWYGARLVRSGEIEGGDIMIILFNMLIGLVGLGQASTHYRKYQSARVAAAQLFKVIDRESEIDALATEGDTPKALDGLIEFQDVEFAYPGAPTVPVLRGISFKAEPGQTVAFVGHSGSGKSTVVSLLERFYNPQGGKILLDSKPIGAFNVQWLRRHIGFVTQTPVLLPTSIYENIAMGKGDATKEEIIRAAKQANAHDFIMDFPDGYDTLVGNLGSQLSGGQRQRISIARVLCGDPKVLLLDEATSALDNQSESVVQEALDTAQAGRTTIVIAHRLSTIQDADKIVVLDEGRIAEHGTHDELVARRGIYAQMAAHGHSKKKSKKVAGEGNGEEGEEGEAAADGAVEAVSEDDKASAAKDTTDAADQAGPKEKGPAVLRWAWGMARPDSAAIAGSFIFTVISGVLWPVNSIILSESLTVIIQEDAEASEVARWCLAYVGLAVVNLIGHFFRNWLAFVAGETMTFRLRKHAFHLFTHQSAAWFDHPEHTIEKLTQILANDIPKMQNVLSVYMTAVVVVITMLFVGIGVALYYCWRIALVVLATIPFLSASGLLMQIEGVTTETGNAEEYAQASAQSNEIMTNIRLITSLGRVSKFFESYEKTLEGPLQKIEKRSRIYGILHIFAEFAKFGAFGLAFWYGAVTIDENLCDFNDMFKSLTAVLFAGIIAGMYAGNIPNFGAGKVAATRVYKMLKECEPVSDEEEGADGPATGPQPTIEFRNVSFVYPLRPTAQVLSNFNLTIPGGKTVALVGPSGSGKSTIISLIQRLYDVNEGEILVDGRPLQSLGINRFRRSVGVVEQEPRLFSTSIKDNITYGAEGGTSDKAVVEAARLANADDFINKLANKYDTNVGKFGSLLSGGQRQRVAIARASIRADSIRILLLDEATSALDVQTEKLVQEAMERASAGKTTVIVAHRLSTIKNADIIAVLDEGTVVEQGSHEELIAKQGAYYRLYEVTEGTKDPGAGSSEAAAAAAPPPPAPTATDAPRNITEATL